MKRIGVLFGMIFMVEELFAVASIFPAVYDSVRLDSVIQRDSLLNQRVDFERDTLIPIKYELPGSGTLPVVYLPDSLILDTLAYEYTKIKDFAYRSKFTKELYKMVFVNPRPGYVNVMRTQNSEERFKDYRGKIIHSIAVRVLPPYGTSVYDTNYFE